MEFSSGTAPRPFSLFIYGPEGIGKTTWCTGAPKALFIDPNGRTARVHCYKRARIHNMKDFNAVLDQVEAGKVDCETIVVDELATIESFIQREVCEEAKVKTISDIDYGKGYDAVATRFRNLLARLEQTGKNIIWLGHEVIRPFKNPEGEDYDKIVFDCDKRIMAQLGQNVEGIFYMRRHDFVTKKETGKSIGLTGKRKTHTQDTAAYKAKNSWQMPATITELRFNTFQLFIKGSAMTSNELLLHLKGSEGLSAAAQDRSKLVSMYVQKEGKNS